MTILPKTGRHPSSDHPSEKQVEINTVICDTATYGALLINKNSLFACNLAVGKIDDKTCYITLLHTWPRDINVMIPLLHLEMLYVSKLMRKQCLKFGPTADRLGCSISIKMAPQSCGGTITNITEIVRVFTATTPYNTPENR